ncbi:cupin domain-containing protein [Parapedobacter koreensis]|uniref:Mannose-6-phosphate isomerase, cupin superfamily n=1 Tax=Parapedobacter koreensis TaxID=332977 RepID=A0A1H7L1Q7_9SPHI|nr:cupin domain-containing protein [Parapedobacter koreensis]SEK92918.1 Mannose-6-phosphate isomerase, cupin superfamily [Parapedobacter koreensis]
MTIIHEDDVRETLQPGRYMRWLTNDDTLKAQYLSVCVIRVLPGEAVRPAHSHPKSEEAIYIISGNGKVMIEGEVGNVKAGSLVLFEQGKVHMLKNTSTEEMKVVCFFAPATSLDNYLLFEDVQIPD